MNTELLEKIKKHILEEPKRLEMDDWASKVEREDGPACGTTGCIAGWAVLLTYPTLIAKDYKAMTPEEQDLFDSPDEAATMLLDISDFQASSLFYTLHWPDSFLEAYLEERTFENHAKVTAERIDFFISTNGLDDEAGA